MDSRADACIVRWGRGDFKNKRLNGDEKLDAPHPWVEKTPDEKTITWTKGEKRSDDYVYGVKEADGNYHYECRYDADAEDLEWMRQTDCNYLKRLLREGNLKNNEPDVWRLREIDGAQNRDIGEWWSEKLKLSNIGGLLSNSKVAYKRFNEGDEKARVAREQKAEQEQRERAEREKIRKDNAERERVAKEEKERRAKQLEEQQRKAEALKIREAQLKKEEEELAKKEAALKKLQEAGELRLKEEKLKLEQERKANQSKESASKSINLPGGMNHIKNNSLTFKEKIGDGAFGVVYKGEWNHTVIAIKKLHAQDLTERSIKEFKNETEMMAGLHHPNIIQFYGACFEPGHYSMVMELMPKSSLFKVLHNDQDLPWNIRFNIAMDITNGLAHLHSKEIIHRDLKSLNVLLDNNMRAKLTDFGLAKVKTETRSTTTVNNKSVGTLAWMAPETLLIKPEYTKKSDIYSYGMILWEIASRELPFAEADPSVVKDAIKQGETEEVPEEIESAYPRYADIIKRCWLFKATARPGIEEIATALKSFNMTDEGEIAITVADYEYQLKSGPSYDNNFCSQKWDCHPKCVTSHSLLS